MLLLKKAHCYAPQDMGVRDILIGDETILGIGPKLSEQISEDIVDEVELCDDCYAVPGFVDGHVHIIGGGGEGGFSTRTPEGTVFPFFQTGTTTVIGLLGTDGLFRDHRSLLAKARAFREEGLLTYILSGSYHFPPRTITGNVGDDIMLIPEVLGIGEIAVSDHRGSAISGSELQRLALDARRAGMLSKKTGTVVLHMGDGKEGLSPLFEAVSDGTLPPQQLLPTHIARNPRLLEEGKLWIQEMGGSIDFTAGSETANQISDLRSQALPMEKMLVSTDGLGSMPIFDHDKAFIGLDIANVDTLFPSFVSLIRDHRVPMEQALLPFTQNVGKAFGLLDQGVGQLKVSGWANLLLIKKETLQIRSVYSLGKNRLSVLRRR